MEKYVWLNGAVVESESARISALDHGLLFGDGVFETMRATNGCVHLLNRHLERLRGSAERLGIPFEPATARVAVVTTLEANQARECVVRLTLTGGLSHIGGAPTLLVVLRELPPRPSSQGLRLVTLETPHAGFGVKSISYLPYLLAMRERERLGFDEGVLLTRDGFVAEGAVTNIFMVEHGVLVTPPLGIGIVPGIARRRVLELAAVAGFETREELFGIDELREAEEVFVTNAVRGVRPVQRVDEDTIRSTRVGAMLRAQFDAEAPNEEL